VLGWFLPMGIATNPERRDAVYALHADVVLRDVAGEHLLVPIRHNVADMQAIFAMTGIGVRIWRLLDGTRTLGAVQDAILEGFDVDAERAWADLCEFIESLEEHGLVERRA
jgi:hypothetical protein